MIPGPVTVAPDVRHALSEPVRSHTSAATAATLRRVEEGLRVVVGGESARVYVFAGAGTLAMEVALVNHARPGDRIVVVSHGYFGDRFAEIAEVHGLDVEVVGAPWGTAVEPAAVAAACARGRRPAVVTVTHVDTSTGVLADVPALAAAAAHPDTLVVLDGVCATGGVEEAMDAWGVDVVLTGAQKALALPPGLAILASGARGRARRAGLGPVRSYYGDLARWDRVLDDPGAYFSTHATGMLRALEVSLDAVLSEGMPARAERHRRLATRLRDGMGEMGFGSLTDPGCLAPTLSVLESPAGVDDATLRAGMARAGVVVAGCLGPFAGRGIRVGHMGGVTDADIDRTLAAAAEALEAAR